MDIAAPGSNITSANTSFASNYATNPYTAGNGTSYAAPHVAGVAALIVEALPTKTPAQIRAAIESSAGDLGASGSDPLFGAGFVRPAEAITAANAGGGDSGASAAFHATTPTRVVSMKPKAGVTVPITIAGENGVAPEFRRSQELYFGGDMEASIALSGQVAGRIDSVKPVAEIISEMVEEFETLMDSLSSRYARTRA